MTPEEKAKDLYNTFQQYTWDEELGWMPDDASTRKTVRKVINEIEMAADDWGVLSPRGYWTEVKKELLDIYRHLKRS